MFNIFIRLATSSLQVIRLMKGETGEKRPEVVIGDMSRPVCDTHTHTHACMHARTPDCVLSRPDSGHGEQH